VETPFGSTLNRISLENWIDFLETTLLHSDGPIKNFFRSILLNETSIVPEIPNISTQSEVLSPELWPF